MTLQGENNARSMYMELDKNFLHHRLSVLPGKQFIFCLFIALCTQDRLVQIDFIYLLFLRDNRKGHWVRISLIFTELQNKRSEHRT